MRARAHAVFLCSLPEGRLPLAACCLSLCSCLHRPRMRPMHELNFLSLLNRRLLLLPMQAFHASHNGRTSSCVSLKELLDLTRFGFCRLGAACWHMRAHAC